MPLTPPQPRHDQPLGPCSFPGAGSLLCLSTIVLIPVLPHLLQAGPHRCLILPSTGCRAGRLPLGLTGSSCAQNSHYGCVGTPGLTRTGLGTAHCHGHARQPALPSSAHPLTRAWVVGKGCRSRGFGSLGIRSSGSTLTCERQAVRQNLGSPGTGAGALHARAVQPRSPRAGSGWKAQAQGSEPEGDQRTALL